MKKITLLFLFTIGIMMVNGQTSQIYLHTQGTQAEIPVKSCSDNNRYFIGTFNGSAFIYDYQTGTLTEHVYVDDSTTFYEFMSVSDSGVVAGATGSTLDNMQPMSYKSGTATKLSTTGLPNFYYGCANGITADGEKLVGYIDYGGNKYYPILWNNNVASILPFPAIDITGETAAGAVADHISTDGSVIVGRYYTDSYIEIGIIWKYNTATNNYDEELFSEYINFDTLYDSSSANFHTGKYIDFTSGNLSGNGKYLIGTLVQPIDISTTSRYPIVFDFENNNDTTTYKNNNDALGMFITNDGLVTVATPFLPTPHRDSYVYIANDNFMGTEFDYYLEVEYNFTSWPSNVLASTGTALSSNDGTIFFGYTRGTYTGDMLNYYACPTAAVENKEVVNIKSGSELSSTIVEDNLVLNNNMISIKIYDATGRVILQENNSSIINVSNLTNGIYLIEMINNDKEIKSEKFIKR